jgi:hypothetical protein
MEHTRPANFPVGALTNSLQMALNGIRRERSAAFGRKDEAAIEELSAKRRPCSGRAAGWPRRAS